METLKASSPRREYVCLLLFPQRLLQNVRVRRIDSLIVLGFCLDDFESELPVELDGTFVADLHVKVHTIELPVLLADLQHVLQHLRPETQTSVRRQTRQRHNVQSTTVVGLVDATTDGADDDVVEVGEPREFSDTEYVFVELVVIGDG